MIPELVAQVAADPSLLPRLFASAGRRLRGLGLDAPASVWVATPEDELRIALLAAVPTPWSQVDDLWRHGDAAERRAVLRALGVLPDPDPEVLGRLVAEALRTNDPRLVAAALSERALDALDDAALGQAVLKVAFLDLDLRDVPGIVRRVTPALVHQLMGLVLERVAAGRPVPTGTWDLVAVHPDDDAEEQLREELWSRVPARREAACAALQGLEAALA